MPTKGPKEPVPAGFKTWREFHIGKKEIRKRKQEYLVQKLEKQKQKEAEPSAKDTKNKKDKKKPICEEPSTLSIAVPGSILDNAQSVELRTYLAGQIARAACVYKVDEVIVYDDVGIYDRFADKTVESLSDSGEVRPARPCCATLARILQYLECPQYLRKEFFPFHKDLEYAGLLNPLDAPHHMRMQDDERFREGVVLPQPARNGSYVNVGLLKHVKVGIPLQSGIRVTVEMLPTPPEAKRLCGRVVSPSQPQKETGVYWGYSVRLASSLNTVFTECPYKEGYDVSIGTSERGTAVETVSLPSHHHALVVFGGLAGIEAALEADPVLTVDDPALLFDHYLNTCPNQGSRTIRTEEALLISLAELRTKLKPKVQPTIQSKTQESDDDLKDSDSGSDDDFEGNIKEDSNVVGENDSEKPIKDEDISSETCNSHVEVKKRKKRSSVNDSVDSEQNESKKIKSDDSLDNDHNSSAEIGAKIPEKEKRKKKVLVAEETDEAMDVNLEPLHENTQNVKRKKDKRRSKNGEGPSSEGKEVADPSIDVAEEGMTVTSELQNISNVKRKKDKRRHKGLGTDAMEIVKSSEVKGNSINQKKFKKRKGKKKQLAPVSKKFGGK
ncbi:putative methyltransferase C9orf114 [Thrips palmi]|uniref:Methyltransferase C9orf114 n=1 Tax=Thrips palmi TaxID=161013 RepID=A0A6P8ZUF8_THRPL|nr:putative methyltransferase C9orf114 [Thrips palmi]XP_034248934.1 putative methyltransferase C9orf114 [Thrips palmi]